MKKKVLTNDNEKKILVVGHLYPEELGKRILNQIKPPIQTQRFGKALINSIYLNTKNDIKVVSTAPLLDFPHSEFLISPFRKWIINEHISIIMLPYVNLPIFKHISRFIMISLYVFFWSLKNSTKIKYLILHGIQSCKIWGIFFGTYFFKNNSFVIPFLTDDIGIPQVWEGSFIKRIRFLDVYLIKLGLKKIDGVISMTEKLAQKLSPDKPLLIINTIYEKFLPQISINYEDYSKRIFNIVYSGGLYQEYGISRLIEAFQLNKNKNWFLYIAGQGEMSGEIKNISEINRNIVYLGFLDSMNLIDLYNKAHVFVNPRPLNFKFVDYSFPSKIVEYLSTGKPVVSTNLPVFDEKIKENLVITKDDSAIEIFRCLLRVSNCDIDQIKTWSYSSTKYVNDELSSKAQGEKIINFITSFS